MTISITFESNNLLRNKINVIILKSSLDKLGIQYNLDFQLYRNCIFKISCVLSKEKIRRQ